MDGNISTERLEIGSEVLYDYYDSGIVAISMKTDLGNEYNSEFRSISSEGVILNTIRSHGLLSEEDEYTLK